MAVVMLLLQRYPLAAWWGLALTAVAGAYNLALGLRREQLPGWMRYVTTCLDILLVSRATISYFPST